MIIMATFLAVFKTIGSVVGIIITLMTFFGIISKKPKEAFKRIIREEVNNANQDLKQKISELEEEAKQRFDKVDTKISQSDETDLVLLRNTITHIYIKYKDTKKIPHYVKENVMYLFAQYKILNGNSYVAQIVREMKEWEEII